MIGMGLSLREGNGGATKGVPDLEKAPDLYINLASASMPLFVPKSTGRAKYLNVFSRILWWCSYLGHSVSGSIYSANIHIQL